ncbi:MAG: Asp-tRNA(Asn)/Glu-tRNA(Gln) amidotransferase subunit GatB [Candidatus Omnitrophica bacterium]|nr:Asp-tRNA(Asn)/Glu-tRNA(Gln) amidotransferase subunit GatB [Candidatus Omnitrophota bacterium]
MQYEPVIGLEVHVQLSTKSKLFCACSTQFGEAPNQNTCPVCMGWPGSLPVLNEEALKLAVRVGLALHCQVSEKIKFDRKNYFYPDLPKAYQISQYDMPVNKLGWVEIEIQNGKEIQKKKIGITRAHLEEDAGKLLHEGVKDGSLVDYNRAGTPLLEIVSEPEIYSPKEAYEYLKTLKMILEYLEVSDCNMEEGSLRCDANISVRPVGEMKLGTKTEIKNMNSFRAVERALNYEIGRQMEMAAQGEKILQETRLWDETSGQTFSMRSKEEAHDYRYFPEPDLVPFRIAREMMDSIQKALPELPAARAKRFQDDYQLSAYDASVLTQEKALANYFEACVKEGSDPKTACNWILSEVLALLNAKCISVKDSPVQPKDLLGMLRLIEDKTISGKIAKEILPLMFETMKSAADIVQSRGLTQVNDAQLLEDLADKIVQANPVLVEDYRAGKKKALAFFVGQIMKETKGKANPQLVNEILVKKLGG